jgi:hypothetical protein
MAVFTTYVAIGLTALSIAYQAKEARKAKKRAAEAADARKGFEVPTERQSISLPVVYGRALIGGAQVFHDTKSSYTYADLDAPGQRGFTFNMQSNISGEKNEFLYVQQALCHGPIHDVIDWKLDDQNSDTTELHYGQRLIVQKNGGFADSMITANFPERENSVFTNTAYASMAFRLNRDEPQYGGVPSVAFYIEGKLVRPIIPSGSGYVLGNYTYSNNPALCLLDYLIDNNYGRGLSLSEIDLASFYKGFLVCESIVQFNVPVDGRIWRERSFARVTQRNLPLYECNVVLDTEKPIRENIITLLSSMGDSDLVWSAGKYKLQIQYPAGTGAIEIAGELGDDDIVRSDLSIKYPSASERMNFCTIRFSDEAQDFAENTASWPPRGSSMFNTLRSQDNNIPLENSFNEEAITDYYHALAKAEELVRVSRTSVAYTFTAKINNTFYEPGDILFVNSPTAKIINEYLKIIEIKVTGEGTAEITAVKFDPNQLAWNAKDDQIVPVRNNYNFRILPPTSITFNYYPELATTGGLGFLQWVPPVDIQPANYIVEFMKAGQNNWQMLGTTSDNQIDVFSLKTGSYDFSVRSRSTLGSTSVRSTTGFIEIEDGTSTLPSIQITDEIVLSSGKVITNLYIELSDLPSNNFIVNYEVQVRKQGDDKWISLGVSKDTFREYVNVVDQAVYEVQARTINRVGATSEYVTGTHSVVGKTTPPSDVSNFTACSCRDGIRLRWSAINDLDRDLYEIRTGTSWENSTLVVRTKETEFIIERPTVGLKSFYIKAIDTTGNYSLNESFAEILVEAPSQVVVTSTIVGENYLLQWSEPNSVQQIEEYIIKQDSVEITRIKSTSFTSKVQWLGISSFSIIAVDLAGNESDESITQISVSVAPPTSVRSQVVDNNVLLFWDEVRGTLPTIGYELRKGSTLETSILIGFLNSEFSVVFESISGDYTYWVVPKDSSNNSGQPASVTTRVAQPPDYILALDYYSDFSGTKFNVVDAAGEGILLPFNSSRTWNDQFVSNSWTNVQNAIDSIYSLYIQPSFFTGYYEEVYDYGLVLQGMRVKVIPTIEIVAGSPSYKIDISISENGVDYTDYIDQNQIFATNFRYIKFRLTVNTTSDLDVLSLSKLNLVLDAKLKTDSGSVNALATDAEGTVVNFVENFLDIASINVSANSTTLVTAIYDFTDVPNPTSFKILVFNSSGARVNANVSWTARGY